MLQPQHGLSARLEHIGLVLLPNTTRVTFASGRPDATAALQHAVATTCTSLASRAWVCCHRRALATAEVAAWYQSIRPDARWYEAAFRSALTEADGGRQDPSAS